MPPKSDDIPSWEECISKGMTVQAAAALRGVKPSAGHAYLKRRGINWPGRRVPYQSKNLCYQPPLPEIIF